MAANPAYASPAYTEAPITGAQLAALSPEAVRKLWKAGVDVHEETGDFCAEMEGNSPMSIIQTETDTSKGAGQQITFTNKSGLYAEAHMGEERFTDSRHYEELLIGTNQLKVDWFRHGVDYTERSEEYIGMRGELVAGLPAQLGDWAGRLKTEKQFMVWREKINGENKITLPEGLNWNNIVTYSQQMKRWGAASAMVGRGANGKAIRRYCVVACTDALTSLKLDQDYRDVLKNTNHPQGMKYIFDGGFVDIDGHVIKEYEAIEHDGYGAIGSPMNPMGKLGVAMTALNVGAVNYIVLGGSDYARDTTTTTFIKPSKWFPEFAYRHNVGDTESVPAAGTTSGFWVAIINPPNAATDPGKYGLYKCGIDTPAAVIAANDGKQMKIVAGLAATATAATGATEGAAKVMAAGALGTNSPEWNPNLHTNNHPVDALVVQVWPTGTPLFHSFILGAAASRRGYGKHRNKRTYDQKEGGFARQVYFNTVMGSAIRTNRVGRAPGITRITHTGILAGTPLPTP